MTVANPSFNASEFELRNFTNKYLSPDQTEQVSLTESRVNGQLDFLAQMLGWSGSNYWTNLPATVSQKRQLLGGSYGVYNNFILPRVLTVKTWENIEDFSSPRIAIVEIERDDRIQAGQIAYLDIYAYPILSLTETAAGMVLNFGEVDDTFFTEINNNTQLRVDIPSARPAPFYRPEIGVAGDNAFNCADNNGTLTLFPSYDTTGIFPYLFPILFAGSAYSFNKPLYLSYSDTLSVDVSPTYNEDTGRWVLSMPNSLGENSPGVTAILVWAYSDDTTPTDSTLQVQIQNWRDPSDWNIASVLDNFLGAWGNKGGPLPFNLAFDSLSLHGYDENNSLYLPVIERELAFNDVVDLVYAQRATIDSGTPGQLPPGKLWWNTTSGVLAIQVEQEETCPIWVEVEYREAPEQELVPEIIFPDVAAFVANQGLVPPSTISIVILDITGLSSADNVLNIDEPFTGSGRVYLYRQPDTQYWVPIRFEFLNVGTFDAASVNIPFNVPTYILNSTGLDPVGANYTINNLEITVSGMYKTVLVKENGPTEWTLFPDSILKFIANSSLFGGPVEGELWWDFEYPDPENRAAALYYDSTWVAINQNTPITAPPSTLDMGTVLFYCDGNLLTAGVGFLTDDYEFTYDAEPKMGLYFVQYRPLSLTGKTNFPEIVISDSLTSSYKLDISSLVFSGVAYKMSPNVYDAETPLRLWASEHLQTANTTELLLRDIYPNPLVADLNNGPALDNWQRFFVRMPLDYGRNGAAWQKAALICEDFAYYGSNIEPEKMDCPPGASLPKIYEEVVLNNDRTDYTYVYSEPFLYSTVVYDDFSSVDASYTNGAVRPTVDVDYDEFSEAQFIDYDPLHNRLVDFSDAGFGNWQGVYLNINACGFLSGYYINDIIDAVVEPIEAPIWDASIYKCPPTCDNPSGTYSVDANNYKICYAYFVADASVAEDGFFDPQQEAAWRIPETQPKTLYIVPKCPAELEEPSATIVTLIPPPPPPPSCISCTPLYSNLPVTQPPYDCNTAVNTAGVTDFSSAWEGCNALVEFPCLDTSAGTSFYSAWWECSGLTSFPKLDLSSGVNFSYAWGNCTGLTSFPELCPLSSGDDFSWAWYGCTGLTSFPLLDISSGTDFSNTWWECSGLTSFPALDLSSGTTFYQTWRDCTGLTSFPLLDVSSGTNFEGAWVACLGLTSFPLLNVSSGTNFNSTWSNCSSLTSFPLLDVSSGIDFEYAWSTCASLTSFPMLDVSNGTNFYGAWNLCSSLTSFPLIDVSSGTIFVSAWLTCTNLTSFPLLDVSSGTNFDFAWKGCTNLTSFPLLDVSNGTSFQDAWSGCNSLTSFPLLDVSNGTNFNNAWRNCINLTTFPAGMFDTCAATYFGNTWRTCALNQTSVDNILVSLDTAGQNNGIVGIFLGTSAAPGVAGAAAKLSLQAKGWTVTTN